MQAAVNVKKFVHDADVEWQHIDKGVKRKIMSYEPNLMVVKVAFEKDGIGKVHNHYHSQISYVESGKFEIEIGGEKKILTAGDVFYAQPNIMHGAVCLEEGVLIDVFSPMREDFV
jgi:quercetin dioxygenase-like cupin family protein